MKELDLQHLFYDSPYPVKLDDGEYVFRTDHDIVYAVSFKSEPFFDPIPAYWFDLTNRQIMGSVLLIIFQDRQSTNGNANETSNELS